MRNIVSSDGKKYRCAQSASWKLRSLSVTVCLMKFNLSIWAIVNYLPPTLHRPTKKIDQEVNSIESHKIRWSCG